MSRIWIVWACLICLVMSCTNRRYLKEALPYKNTVYVTEGSGRTIAHQYMGGKTRRFHPARTYMSYRRDSIFATQGAVVGRPLHGLYRSYYPNQGLKAQGYYRYGLRDGEWREWDEQGVLGRISQWKQGVENGQYAEFNDAGEVTVQGRKRDGLWHGNVRTYQFSDSLEVEQKFYRRGEQVEHPSFWQRVVGWF